MIRALKMELMKCMRNNTFVRGLQTNAFAPNISYKHSEMQSIQHVYYTTTYNPIIKCMV